MREIKWNLYKVYLKHPDSSETDRRKEMLRRFDAGGKYVWEYRRVPYTYGFYDLALLKSEVYPQRLDNIERIQSSKLANAPRRSFLTGFITRTPKRAHGRTLDPYKQTSSEATVDIHEIADAAEFIYDFESCVLAIHKRAPFNPTITTVRALTNMLGERIVKNSKDMDVHVGIMYEDDESFDAFESTDPIKRVRLVIARDNPGPALGDLSVILDTSDGDDLTLDLKKKSSGGLKLPADGLVRNTARATRTRGYLKRAMVYFRDRTVNLLKADPRVVNTEAYAMTDQGEQASMEVQASRWKEAIDEQIE